MSNEARLAATLAAAALLVALGSNLAATAATVRGGALALQQTGGADESQGGEQGKAGAGQSKPDAETGASKDESESATEKTGPPWTYQMARITIGLTILLFLGTGYLYWRLVVTRRRREA